jgi:hypothetical protein
MTDRLIEVSKQLIEYVENGDYMTALSYFESDARSVVEATDTHPNLELLKKMRIQLQLVDEENWQQVLYNCDEIGELLNG